MSRKREYIEIENRLSLNVWKDGAADMRENREFQILKNYIPAKGEIRTREGITPFVHTPSTTYTVWEPETPGQTWPTDPPTGDYGVIQAVFPFNSDGTIGDNLLDGTTVYSAMNSVSRGGGASVQSTVKVEGAAAYSALPSGSPAQIYGLMTNTEFPSWMPGDTASSTKKFLITYWIYPTEADASANAEWHFTFGNRGVAGEIAFGMRHFDTRLQSFWQGSSGGTIGNLSIESIVTENQWQFVAAWYDGDTGFQGIYHYNAVTLVETYTSTVSVPVGMNHFLTHGRRNTINARSVWNGIDGNHCDGSDAFHGYMDYVTMWSQPMHLNNSSNITLVRYVRAMSWL